MSKDLAVAEPKNEVAIIFDKINSGLEAFENRKEELTLLKSEAEGLKIESIDDRQGINQVSTIRKKLKNARVEIEKEGKAMRDPLTKISKSISAKEQELVAIIEPTEKTLKAQEDWVKQEEARIEAEVQRKEDERIQNRVDRLAAYGYGIDINFLKGLDDDQFEGVVSQAKTEHEKELAAKVEAERLQKEEQERINREREELRQLRAKQEEADRILKERQEEIERKEREMKEQDQAAHRARTKARIGQLAGLGMIFDRIIGGGSYCYNGIYVSYGDQVEGLADDYWDILLEEVTKSIGQEKKEAEEKRIAEEERIRKEAAAKALEEQKEREAESARQEAERIAQSSDRDKFDVILAHLEACPYPDMKSAKHKKLLAEVKDLSAKVIAHIKAKA